MAFKNYDRNPTFLDLEFREPSDRHNRGPNNHLRRSITSSTGSP